MLGVRESFLRETFEARVLDGFNFWMGFEELRNLHRILRLLFTPNGHRFRRLQRQERGVGCHDVAVHVLDEMKAII